MAALNENVKLFIVIALARHLTPSQVADAVKEEFDLDVNRMQIQAYDPNKVQGKHLSKKFKEIFEKTRENFITESSQTPIALKNYRVQMLQLIFNKEYKTGNRNAAKQTLEQAAKEEGGFFTNKVKIGDMDGRGLLQGFYDQIKAKPWPVAYQVKGQVIDHAAQPVEKEVVEVGAGKPTVKQKKVVSRD
jgi:hypothetical protein